MTTKTLNLKFNADDLRRKAKAVKGDLAGIDEQGAKVDRSFGKLAKSTAFLAAGVGAGAVAIGVTLAKSFTEAAVTSENYRIRLNALLGSQQEGNRAFEEGARLAAQLPFEYEHVMGAVTQLAGVVDGGVDEITGWIPIIADLATVSGLSIEETTGQVQRMLSAGANSADLFRERGILSMLGFESGVKISAEETKKALIDAYESPASRFRGASEDMAKTWEGTMSMMSDKVFQFKNAVMDEGIFAYFKEVAAVINEEMGDALDGSTDTVEAFGKIAIDTFNALIVGAGHIADFLDIMITGFQTIGIGIDVVNIAWHKLNAVTWEAEKAVRGFFGASDETLSQFDKLIAEANVSIEENKQAILDATNEIVERSEKDWSQIAQGIADRATEAANAVTTSNTEIQQSNRTTAEELAKLAEEEKRIRAEQKAASEAAKKAAEEEKKAQAELRKEKERVQKATEELLDDMEFELRSLTLTSTELEIQTRIRAAHEQGIYDQDEAIRTHVEALERERAELEKNEEALRKIQDESERFEKRWETMVDNIQTEWANTIDGALWNDGIESFGDFTDTLLDMFKRMVSEMVASWLASGIIELLNGNGVSGFSLDNLFGGGGGGGGIISGIGSIFGSGGGGLGGLGSIFGGGGGLGSIFGGAGGLGGIFSGIGGGISAALGGIGSALGGIGSAIGGAISGAVGGLGSALSGIAAALGPVGLVAGGIAALVGIFGGGARSFDQIVAEDYLPDLLGQNIPNEAVGANGATGFNGGNTAIFGANFGIQGTGITSQLLVDGGENGNGGFFNGAQKNLEEFAEVLRANGIEAKIAHGTLRALSRDNSKTAEDIKNLWQEYADGLTEAVAHSEVFATATENNLIKPSNLFFENFALGFGQSAFEARDSLLVIDEAFDKLVMDGMAGQDALFQAISEHYGIAIQDAQYFVEQSGVSAQQWVDNFTNASGQNLQAILDFNADGVTQFEGAVASMNQIANTGFNEIGGRFGEVMGQMSGVATTNIQGIGGEFVDLAGIALGQAQVISDNFGVTLGNVTAQTNTAISNFEAAIDRQTARLVDAQERGSNQISNQVKRGAETRVGTR